MNFLLTWVCQLLGRLLRATPLPKVLTEPPKTRKGCWYRLADHEMGCWYATCHTVGDAIWVTHLRDADVLNSHEANTLYYLYLKAGTDVHLYEVPKSDARHPLHHNIPGVTKHYQLLRTVDNKWFARAVVDGITYETISFEYASEVRREVERGSMFDHMQNKEANEKSI